MKFLARIVLPLSLLLFTSYQSGAQTPVGTEVCKACHESASFGGTQFTMWANTLHARIHLLPDSITIRPHAGFVGGDSIDMGASFGNAKAYLRRSGAGYFVRLGASGPEYAVAQTYGWGYMQRYLVKIDASFYVLPVQYNLKGYMDNTAYASSNWVAYDPGQWFNPDGSLRPTNVNTFRRNSWDKSCMGCHVTGGRVILTVNGTDSTWTSSWAMSGSDLNMAIGCENCHGPYAGGYGPGHQMNPTKLGSKSAKLEVCGQCHLRTRSKGGSHEYPRNEVDNTYFNPADPARPLSMFVDPGSPNTAGGPSTWPDLKTARANRQQYQEMLGSGHYTSTADITCFTCHSAHSNSPNKHDLVDSMTVEIASSPQRIRVSDEDNTLCLACHAGVGPFSSIPKSWLLNEPLKRDSIGRVVNRHTHHDRYDPFNLRNSGALGRCTVCHMTRAAISVSAYDLRSHTFAVIPPSRTIQFKDVPNGMMNTCAASCHRNPSGPTSGVDNMEVGIDGNLTDWTEATDIALAQKLWQEWQSWGWSGVLRAEGPVPSEFRLSQNYPNPFNPTTQISVELPVRETVRLSVYSVAGQEVARLMDGQFEAGTYQVRWNGKDGEGLPAATGVYLYRLEVGSSNSTTRKMLLLK